MISCEYHILVLTDQVFSGVSLRDPMSVFVVDPHIGRVPAHFVSRKVFVCFRMWEMKNLLLLFGCFLASFLGGGENRKIGRAYYLVPRTSHTWSFRIFLSWQTEKKINLGSFRLTHYLSTHQHRPNLVDVICDWKYILNQYIVISALVF